jgi:hypothetical protein
VGLPDLRGGLRAWGMMEPVWWGVTPQNQLLKMSAKDTFAVSLSGNCALLKRAFVGKPKERIELLPPR